MSSLLKISVSTFLTIFSFSAHAGNPLLHAGAAEAGSANVCIMKTGFWSSIQNQASLAFNKSFSIGFNYENRFNISELAIRTAGVIIPAGKASLAAVYSHSGYSDLSRDFAGLACGLRITEKVSAGIQADYFYQRTIGEYNDNKRLTFEGGFVVELSENTRIGIHVFNPLPQKSNRVVLPSSLRIGAGTYLNKSLFAGAEAEMETGRRMLLRTGFDYEAGKNFLLRAGYCSENSSFSFGLGYKLKAVQIDLGFMSHEKLGITSSASLIFKIH